MSPRIVHQLFLSTLLPWMRILRSHVTAGEYTARGTPIKSDPMSEPDMPGVTFCNVPMIVYNVTGVASRATSSAVRSTTKAQKKAQNSTNSFKIIGVLNNLPPPKQFFDCAKGNGIRTGFERTRVMLKNFTSCRQRRTLSSTVSQSRVLCYCNLVSLKRHG